MRIALAVPRTNVIRHFESVVLLLAKRGHELAIVTPGRSNDWPLPEKIARHPRITCPICPETREDEWKTAATDFRLLVDCARYLRSPFLQADKLRARAFQTFARHVSGDPKRHLTATCPSCHTTLVDDQVGALVPPLGTSGSARLEELARLVEEVVPTDPVRDRFLAEQRPDVVLVSPLVRLGSEQADWVKSARARGIPVGFPVFSWDNLTTKGLIHVQPDHVFVWNDIQKREAIEYHGVPEDRIDVTGAPRFDAFFDLDVSMDRWQFSQKYGLDEAAPIVTYLCSSEFVAGSEVAFVERWIEEIRQEPGLASCNVAIRPHPRSLHHWAGVDVSRWRGVSLVRSRRLNADQSLFDTLYHSSAVVGLNTSAQLEAGILGKPVLTILAPGFERGQEGTLHFRYLLRSEGGFVEVAKDFEEHRSQLLAAVDGRYDAAHIRRFIERFIRPLGWEKPATPILADAILRLSRRSSSGFGRWFRTRR
jgi:hypothetical protein